MHIGCPNYRVSISISSYSVVCSGQKHALLMWPKIIQKVYLHVHERTTTIYVTICHFKPIAWPQTTLYSSLSIFLTVLCNLLLRTFILLLTCEYSVNPQH